MMAGALSVSPREVVDMVHRASRAEGCSAGLADRVAVDIAFCEVHHGAGIAAWLGLADRSSAHLVEAVRSAYRLDLAVIEVQATGAGRQAWEPAIPFALVMTGALPPQATALIVMAFAVVQIVVHMIYFLHMNSKSEGGWTMLALIFTIIVVVIALSGSLWVMYHLNTNMMPATHEMSQMSS